MSVSVVFRPQGDSHFSSRCISWLVLCGVVRCCVLCGLVMKSVDLLWHLCAEMITHRISLTCTEIYVQRLRASWLRDQAFLATPSLGCVGCPYDSAPPCAESLNTMTSVKSSCIRVECWTVKMSQHYDLFTFILFGFRRLGVCPWASGSCLSAGVPESIRPLQTRTRHTEAPKAGNADVAKTEPWKRVTGVP